MAQGFFVDEGMMRRVMMSSAVGVAVKHLSGFSKKLHRAPERAGSAADHFVGEVTLEELQGDVNGVAKRSREFLGFGRREVSAVVRAGAGSVITPGFEYAVVVGLDAEVPTEVVWRRDLRNIGAELWSSGKLDLVFVNVFDRIEMAFEEKASVEEVIDRIEGMKDAGIKVEYEDTDLSKCEVRVAGFAGRILVTEGGLTILSRGMASPSELLGNFQMAQRLVLERAGRRGLGEGGGGEGVRG